MIRKNFENKGNRGNIISNIVRKILIKIKFFSQCICKISHIFLNLFILITFLPKITKIIIISIKLN